jgi:transposase-like protein
VGEPGKSVDFLLRRDRGIAAAQAFFRKALATNPTRWPRKLSLDGHTPSHRALRLLRGENPKWNYVEARSCKYLNNIIEQDRRAIKRCCASMKGFESFTHAAITIAGIELAHRIHKRQVSFGLGRPRRNCLLKLRWQRALAEGGSCQVAKFHRCTRPPLHRNRPSSRRGVLASQ